MESLVGTARRSISVARSLSRGKSPTRPQSHVDRKDYAIGIVLLLLVVFLWTSSSFVTKDIYQDGYEKPFLVTYLNTSAFAFYLIPFLVRRALSQHNDNGYSIRKANRAGTDGEYQPLVDESLVPNDYDERLYASTMGSSLEPSSAVEDDLMPLTIYETAQLAFGFCFLWFVANWSVNASLGYTSVASSTILTSTSGFFTLGIGRVFGVESFTLMKIGAVFVSFTGVVLVSLSDSDGTAGPTLMSAIDPRSSPLLGDFLSIISAVFYALYVILLKVRIRRESRIDMQLFFGFVGLFNVLSCWPIGLVLHLTGAEPFELPPTTRAWSAILINMLITLSSDYLYVLAMLKTTPLVVTVGLSLTIPVAVAGDFLLQKPTQVKVIAGAVLVLISFVAIGLDDAKDGTEGDIFVAGEPEDARGREERGVILQDDVELESN